MRFVTVKYDRERHLRYDYNALCDIEQASGKSFIQLAADPGFNAVRALVWGGLKWEDKKLTLEKVGQIMFDLIQAKEGSLEKFGQDCLTALKLSGLVPDAEDANPNAPTGPDMKEE